MRKRDPLPRREFIRLGLTGSAGIVAVPSLILFNQGCAITTLPSGFKEAAFAAMPWLEWEREELVSAAISWLVNHYVAPLLPDVGNIRSAAKAFAKELGLKKERKPSPTGNRDHDIHAEKYKVTNQQHHQMYSHKNECCVRLDHYLRCGVNAAMANVGDLSALEIRAMAMYHRVYGKKLLPNGYRMSYRNVPREWELKYVRYFTHTDGRSNIIGHGYIHKRTREKRFYLWGPDGKLIG